MGNPQRALNAVLSGPRQAGEHMVYPITIGRFACLEKIGSPMITGKPDSMKTIATAWIMTRPIDELAPIADMPAIIQQHAIVWSETLDSQAFNKICETIVEMLSTLYDTSPNQDGDVKKKQTTDG